MCDGQRLWEKYLLPILPSLIRYYSEVIVKDKKPRVKAKAIDKYTKKIMKKKGRVKNQ